MAAMGARFVLVRIGGEGETLARAALRQSGREHEWRRELQQSVRAFLEHLPGHEFALDAEVSSHLAALSSYVALSRSPVQRDYRGDICLVLDAEAPTRLAKTLGQLWRACGLLGLNRKDAWSVVRRVGVDSIPKLRGAILDHLHQKRPEAVETSRIAEAVGHPTTTTRRALEDLAAHGVVIRRVSGAGKSDLWELSRRTLMWRDRFTTVPVLSDTPPSTGGAALGSIKSDTVIDDKTGTVSHDGVF
jgi:hypothetical protein